MTEKAAAEDCQDNDTKHRDSKQASRTRDSIVHARGGTDVLCIYRTHHRGRQGRHAYSHAYTQNDCCWKESRPVASSDTWHSIESETDGGNDWSYDKRKFRANASHQTSGPARECEQD